MMKLRKLAWVAWIASVGAGAASCGARIAAPTTTSDAGAPNLSARSPTDADAPPSCDQQCEAVARFQRGLVSYCSCDLEREGDPESIRALLQLAGSIPDDCACKSKLRLPREPAKARSVSGGQLRDAHE